MSARAKRRQIDHSACRDGRGWQRQVHGRDTAGLDVPESVLAERLTARVGHFMPVELLRSQLATLEPLGEDERGLVVDGTLPTEWLVDRIGGYVCAE